MGSAYRCTASASTGSLDMAVKRPAGPESGGPREGWGEGRHAIRIRGSDALEDASARTRRPSTPPASGGAGAAETEPEAGAAKPVLAPAADIVVGGANRSRHGEVCLMRVLAGAR